MQTNQPNQKPPNQLKMKTLILSVTTFAGFSLAGFAQGYISFDGSNNSNPSPTATSSGLVFINGVSDTGTDINAELLYATSPSGIYGFGFSGTPVVTLLLSSSAQGPTTSIGQTLAALGDITGFANGTLYDQSGSTFQIPNIAAGATAYFQVEAWTGNYNSYNQAMFSDWIQVTSTSCCDGFYNWPRTHFAIASIACSVWSGIFIAGNDFRFNHKRNWSCHYGNNMCR